MFGQALPTFWLGLLLIIFFGLTLRWLPMSGSDTWQHFILPSFVLGYYSTPAVMRLTRSGMLEVLATDYIRTAYSKGLHHRTVLFKGEDVSRLATHDLCLYLSFTLCPVPLGPIAGVFAMRRCST